MWDTLWYLDHIKEEDLRIVARYLPVAPFSLKPAAATSSGGKTLLVPTPYAMKMALLDVAIRTLGLSVGEYLFPALRDLSISLEMPQDLVVMKGFSKIRRPVESKDSKKPDETPEDFEARRHKKLAERMEKGHYPFYPTIAQLTQICPVSRSVPDCAKFAHWSIFS